MTPQEIIEELLRRLREQQTASTSGAPATAASMPRTAVTSSPASSSPSTGPFAASGGIPGLAPGGGIGNQIAGGLGQGAEAVGTAMALAPATGPAAPFVVGAGALLELLSALGVFDFGGVPREAKSQGIEQALAGSANPLDAALSQFVNRGIGQGHVFSESSPSNFGNATEIVANMLQALTGQPLSPVGGAGADFSKPAPWSPSAIGSSLNAFRLPSGYGFIQDPAALPRIMQDIMGIVPSQLTPAAAGPDWKRLLQELIQQNVLRKYSGPLGAPGAQAGTSPGAIPNVSLPHPLAQNPANAISPPYPL